MSDLLHIVITSELPRYASPRTFRLHACMLFSVVFYCMLRASPKCALAGGRHFIVAHYCMHVMIDVCDARVSSYPPVVDASRLQTVCNMCTYEFAEVDVYWPPAAAVPDALSWRRISDESGQNMLQLKHARVHASTNRLCQDASNRGRKHPNGPKTYLFGWSMPITSCGDAHPAVTPMVKYIHCSRGHAILVRKASELEVEVTTTDMCIVLGPDPPGTGMQHMVKVVATVGAATVWDKYIAKKRTPQKLSAVANSIRSSMSAQGIGTLQSKISWKIQLRMTTVAKHIIKKRDPATRRKHLHGVLEPIYHGMVTRRASHVTKPR